MVPWDLCNSGMCCSAQTMTTLVTKTAGSRSKLKKKTFSWDIYGVCNLRNQTKEQSCNCIGKFSFKKFFILQQILKCRSPKYSDKGFWMSWLYQSQVTLFFLVVLKCLCYLCYFFECKVFFMLGFSCFSFSTTLAHCRKIFQFWKQFVNSFKKVVQEKIFLSVLWTKIVTELKTFLLRTTIKLSTNQSEFTDLPAGCSGTDIKYWKSKQQRSKWKQTRETERGVILVN